MSGLEPTLLRLGSAVASAAVRWWLSDRRKRDERDLPLSELINRKITDTFGQRKAAREVEAIADAVAERVAPITGQRSKELPSNERQAALDAVVDAFTSVALADEAFLAADADGAKLAAIVRAHQRSRPEIAGLGELGLKTYDAILDECCDLYARTTIQLGPFLPRASSEILARLSAQAGQIEHILSRLPIRTLDAPDGSREDSEFRERYLAHISTTLDSLELFGVDTRQYRPQTALSVAYVSLAVTLGHADRRSRTDHRISGPTYFDKTRQAPLRVDEEGSLRVEQAFGQFTRVLIRGEAGSGKTTVLRWLAITAARGGLRAIWQNGMD
ncbi:hypothetical protein ACFYPX_31495 [Micromonospora zamorensis]|uniref:NACHT N-terminal Helical domain 1-containing protein n=1 Tax=Micromonospora zamorensis TaxID=709883 RepID=UPI003681D5DF